MEEMRIVKDMGQIDVIRMNNYVFVNKQEKHGHHSIGFSNNNQF